MKQNFNHIQFLLVLLSVFLLVPLMGCWSSHEIEERSLGVGVALDKGKESMIEKEFDEQGGGYTKKNLITSTYQLITPQVASSTTKQGGPQQKSYVNVSETGDSAFQMIRELSLRSDTPLTSPHMKVMVIGEALARSYSLEQLVDQSLRDNDFRPSCLMFISKGRASDTLESKTAGEIPAFRLSAMVENAYRTTRILPPMALIKLESKIQSQSSFLLQNVVSANGEIKFEGAGIIKGKTNKMIGFLNEEELDGLTWITGKGKGGLVKSFDKKTGQLIIYEIESMKSHIQPYVKGNNISFDVHIESVGRLSESWVTSGSTFNNQFLQNAQKTSEKKVKYLVKNVLEKMQKEYRVDVAGFGNRLRIKHPRVWMRAKENWDQTFSGVPINYDVKLRIKDYGASGSTK
ncbi:Ger(x)C family spore germination protein [Priestia megaterium]|uniref:Ger(x)C family spore germination protein n=1 Tax=Priestia megaterium TaxID=1404 RepID=UPI002B24F77E|nr:Ger(x)C family spore germination protein [Priestia megaterium]MEB2294422.1 Ger(x)C family spore germination protein [Priestia megaterium]MEE3897078.1 Ger(x)C family spore germination protein [Priestia megaterium]